MKSTIFLLCLRLIGFVTLPMISETIRQIKTITECMTPTQMTTTCIDVKDCQPLLALLRRDGAKGADFVKKFTCYFEGKNPVVCCRGKAGGSMEQNLYGPQLPPQCGFTNVSHTKIVVGVPAKLNMFHHDFRISIKRFLLCHTADVMHL